MVEIYLEPELGNLVQKENSEEWKAIANHLGMKGQLNNLFNDSSSPIPYLRIDKKWMKVIRTLCPDKDEYTTYSHSVVPLEIMQEIAKCVEHSYFSSIYILYNSREKDPFVVGKVKGPGYSNDQYYLVGRFGDELMPVEVLENKAKDILVKQFTAEVNKVGDKAYHLVEEYLDRDNDTNISFAKGHGYVWF